MTRLIDVDKLKKAIKKSSLTLPKYGSVIFLNNLNDVIDNAPTVEPKKEIVPVCKVTFDKEQLQEIVDKKVAEMIERPQGEWIKNETRPNECQCNKCGNYDLSYFPFCHWCGAEMHC